MSQQEQPQAQEPTVPTPGIVSVNQRGAANDGLAKKFIFVSVVLGLLIVGGFYGVNKMRAHSKASEAEAAARAKDENKPAQVGIRRNFEGDAPPPADGVAPGAAGAQPGANAVADANAAATGCKPLLVTDNKGNALLGADGRPMQVNCDGTVVPAVDPKALGGTTATMAGAGQAGQAGAGGQPAQKPPSRFAGDVLVQDGAAMAAAQRPPSAANDPTTVEGTLALMQALNAQQSKGADAGADDRPRPQPVGFQQPAAAGGAGAGAAAQGNVGSMLTPTLTPKVQAAKIGDRNMLLTKGRQIDCSLSTRLVTEVSGFASCVVSRDVYSANGKVLLLERGSDLQGEYQALMAQGQRRIFVLWDRVVTPNGVVISVASPAADGLGTMGLDGHVDNRWWDRIGAAFLLSFVKDAISYQIAKGSDGGNTAAGGIAYQNTAKTGDSMAERVLSQTINIKPTIYKNQGDRASVYVARDLDFSTVYELRAIQ